MLTRKCDVLIGLIVGRINVECTPAHLFIVFNSQKFHKKSQPNMSIFHGSQQSQSSYSVTFAVFICSSLNQGRERELVSTSSRRFVSFDQ